MRKGVAFATPVLCKVIPERCGLRCVSTGESPSVGSEVGSWGGGTVDEEKERRVYRILRTCSVASVSVDVCDVISSMPSALLTSNHLDFWIAGSISLLQGGPCSFAFSCSLCIARCKQFQF